MVDGTLLSIDHSTLKYFYEEAFISAAYGNHIEIMKRMIELLKGTSIPYSTALVTAAVNESIEAINFLAENQSTSQCYDAALRNAAYDGKLKSVKRLLELCDKDCSWPLSHAAYNGHREVVNFLLTKKVTNYQPAINAATLKGSTEILEMIIACRDMTLE